jgi:DNA-binding NtrC family response regulator
MTEQVLIVEDEFIVANDLMLILEKAGYRVCGIAASVEEARAIIRGQKPDLVLLDIYLKGKLTGIDLAHELREQHIPFVYLSANSNQRVLEAAKATEPYGFLVKPFRAKDVLITLDIARYRHKHSLEFSLRQEALLQEKLTAISTEPWEREKKMLRAVSTLQPFIPFDFLLINNIKSTEAHKEIAAFLRVGFDEYQAIGINELLVITGLKIHEWGAMQSQAASTITPACFNNSEFQKACQADPVKKLIASTFQANALLAQPVTTGAGETYTLLFFSRRPDTWHVGHLALLQRLQRSLGAIISKMSVVDTANHSAAPHKNAGTGAESARSIAGFEEIVGNSHQLLAVLDQVAQVAPFDTSVLILGESGTGKERIAHSLHHMSARRSKPFIKVNCAALPPTLIESELFGHEKGAFTGATDRRVGKFEQANDGTIFLDEIGEMPLELQVKLLRVLQEKEIERIGGRSSFKINVRIVAATNRHLEREVAEGRFRLDLYYRLNVFPVMLPPLRERREDIKHLAHHFATLACGRNRKSFHGIAPKMIAELEAWNWPGNIRELENVIEQSVILNDGASPLELKRPINTSVMVGPAQPAPLPIVPIVQSLTDVRKMQEDTEREYIMSILRKANGRIRGDGGAAQLLNLKPTTLESKMLKLGIKKEDL